MKINTVFLIVIGVGAAIGIGYAFGSSAQDKKLEQEQPIVVEVVRSHIGAMGTLEPMGRLVTVTNSPQMDGGNLRELFVEEGDEVAEGQLVATLDAVVLRRTEVAEAEARVKLAAALLAQTEAGVDENRIQSIQAELASAKLKAQQTTKERNRAERLVRDNTISKEEAERTVLEDTMALENIVRLDALLAEAKTVRGVDIDVRRAELLQAEKALESAKEKHGLTEIRAPKQGRVLRVITRPGERIGTNGILEIGNVSRMVVVAEVYEADLPDVRLGQAAKGTLKSSPLELAGEVVEIGHRIGRRVVLDNDPVADADARVAEVRVLLNEESSRKVENLTNARVELLIDRSKP